MPTVRSTQLLYARQPIYDRKRAVRGYELLFRETAQPNRVPLPFDGDAATSQVLVNAFSDSRFETICPHHPAFVNFTTQTLDVQLPFAPQKLVVEVLESVVPTPRVVNAIRRLKRAGYRIALDDYAQADADHPLLAHADIVKLEYPRFCERTLVPTVRLLKQRFPRLIVLAEKIETRQDMDRCLAAGCDLFQGYFLCRPEPVYGPALPIARDSVVRLVDVMSRREVTIEDVFDVVSDDPCLTLRVMALINGVRGGERLLIDSVRTAMAGLGLERIRAFLQLLTLAPLYDSIHPAVERARVRSLACQRLCHALPHGPDIGFTLGLLSCLEQVLHSFEQTLERLSLHERLVRALLHREGPLGLILDSVIQHEQNAAHAIRWSELAALGIDERTFNAAFATIEA